MGAACAGVRPTPAAALDKTGDFLDLLREPDYGAVYFSNRPVTLGRSGRQWSASGVSVSTEPQVNGLRLKF